MPSLDDHIDLCDELSLIILAQLKEFSDQKHLDPDSMATITFTVFSAYCAIVVQSSGGSKESFMRSLEKCFDQQLKWV